MKNSHKLTDVIFKINREGYYVLDRFFDKAFCEETINEINYLSNKTPNKFKTSRKENSSGDIRI